MSSTTYPLAVAGLAYLQPGHELECSLDGLARFQCQFKGLYSTLQGLNASPTLTIAPSISFLNEEVQKLFSGPRATVVASMTPRAACPFYPSLALFSFRLIGGKNNIGTLECEYRGLNPQLNAPPGPVYEVQVSTSSEPISTNPKWTSDIAGTVASPLNGAIFIDGAGRLKPAPANPPSGYPAGAFDASTGSFFGWLNGSIFEGVEDYLAPSTVFIKTSTTQSSPGNTSSVGQFGNPSGPGTSTPSGYAWFYLGMSFTDEAALYRVQETWKLVPDSEAAEILYNGASGSASGSSSSMGTGGTSGSGSGGGNNSASGGGAIGLDKVAGGATDPLAANIVSGGVQFSQTQNGATQANYGLDNIAGGGTDPEGGEGYDTDFNSSSDSGEEDDFE